MTRHALVVGLAVDPRAAETARRYDGLVDRLGREGWQVTLLTCDAVTDTVSGVVRASNPDVVRVPLVSFPDDPVVSRWPQARVRDPDAWAAKDAEARASAWVGDPLALSRPRLQAAALALHEQRPVSLTVACVPSTVSLAVAVALHRLVDVPYAVDLGLGADLAPVTWWPWIASDAAAVWCASGTTGATGIVVPSWDDADESALSALDSRVGP